MVVTSSCSLSCGLGKAWAKEYTAMMQAAKMVPAGMENMSDLRKKPGW